MFKKGWHTVKGLIIIFVIGLVIMNALGFYFANVFTGSVVVSTGGRLSLNVNQKVTVEGVVLELKLISPNSVKVIVGGIEEVIRKGEVKIVNGLQIKVIESNDNEGETSDNAVLFVRKFSSNVMNVEDGQYELSFGEQIAINGLVVSVLPVDSFTVLFKVGDVNREVSIGEGVSINSLMITLNEVKDFVGTDFDVVNFYAAQGSVRLDCFACNKFDLVYGDSVKVGSKQLTLMGVNEEEVVRFVVDGEEGFVLIRNDVDLNGLNIRVESVRNNDNNNLDRANVLIREVVF